MGGESCDDCTKCIRSELCVLLFFLFPLPFRTLVPSSALVKAYPDTADEKFAKHWDTWFTQDELNTLVAAGINTVRIPVSIFSVSLPCSITYGPHSLGIGL